MHGEGHVWQGVCMAGAVHGRDVHGGGGGHVWQGIMHARETATEVGGIHPTGMDSCFHFHWSFNENGHNTGWRSALNMVIPYWNTWVYLCFLLVDHGAEGGGAHRPTCSLFHALFCLKNYAKSYVSMLSRPSSPYGDSFILLRVQYLFKKQTFNRFKHFAKYQTSNNREWKPSTYSDSDRQATVCRSLWPDSPHSTPYLLYRAALFLNIKTTEVPSIQKP